MARPRPSFASLCICWAVAGALLGLSPSGAQAEDDDAARCNQAVTVPSDTIASCTAVIDSGHFSGRPLAAAYNQRGYARTLKRSLGDAETDLDQAIRIDPDYAEAYANRANFWTVSNKPDRAMTDAEAAVRLNPVLPIAWFVRAGAALNLGQYDRAIADYSETMRLRPGGSAEVLGPRGVAYHKNGDDAHAVADYSEKLKAQPNDVGTLLNRGDALRNLHETSRAAADYGEAIKLAPENPGGWKGRGFIRLSTQDFDGAVADFTEAIRLAPDSGVYLNRGAALSLAGQNARALADDDMAIRLDPNQPLGYVNRGQTLNHLGDRVAALASIDKALQLAPGFPPALEQLKKIGAGGNNATKPAANLSREAANGDYQVCVFPVTDIGPGKDAMSRVIDACTALINSQGGNDDDRAMVHCSAAACIGGWANTNWRWRISPNRCGTIRTRRRPSPAAATPIAA
jgi:tetratricopeptide (TPR) repeat protein